MNLDQQQKAAVETTAPRVLVLAGAGSGKTRVMIERIAWLVETQKVSPYEIMAFTFTRKAAGEIKSRLEERIGNQAYRVTMGTMHALALSMINRFGEIIGLKSKAVTVYSQWEEEFLLRDVAQELGLHNGKAWKVPKKDVDAVFAAYYQRGIEPTDESPIKDLFGSFIARCRENNALTYGGLLIGLRLLIPTLARYLHIKHILVDEVQDIDHLQWAIILEMEKAFGASLFVVGDVDQSIYEWRGAAPKYLVDHQAEFDICRLESNYRSDLKIVTVANNLIGHNQDRITKTMTPTRPEADSPAPVSVYPGINSEGLAKTMQDCMNAQDPAPTAILARQHSLLQKLDRLMTAAGTPHAYVGKDTALTNSEEFRRFHAFLKLLVNPYDNFSFLLIKDILNLTTNEFSAIRLTAAGQNKSHFQVWKEHYASVDYVVDFFNLSADDSMTTAIDILATDPWPFDIEPIFSFASSYSGNQTVENYLAWLATYDIQDEIKDLNGDGPAVTLMTIHAAKGLEWPVVLVAGCNEGIIPSKQAINSDDIEAERRLMYVAMTRARDQLILTVRPEMDDMGRLNPVSRFIMEMGL